MPERSEGFKSCYRHPGKVAVGACDRCGKPICVECAAESGEPGLCAPCKVEMDAEAGPVFDESAPIPMASYDRKPLVAGEVTIFEDGSFEAPEVEPEEEPPGQGPEEEPPREETPAGNAAPPVEDPMLRETLKTWTRPAHPRVTPAGGGPGPGALEPVTHGTLSDDALPAETRQEVAPGRREPEPEKKKVRKQPKAGGPSDQMMAALLWGIGALVLFYGLVLGIAWIIRQWNQVWVFIAGIAVPWAMYHGSTAKKWLSRPLWPKPPEKLLWLSIPSFLLVALSTPLVEFLAYKVIYTTNRTLPFSDFVTRFFGITGWVLVVLGLALSFAFPFFLRIGERWSKPDFIKRMEKEEREKAARTPSGQDPFVREEKESEKDEGMDEDGDGD